MAGNAGLVGYVQCGQSPIPREIVPIQYHLRLILGLGSRQAGIQIQILGPRVVDAKLETLRQAAPHIHLQRVIAGVAFRIPEESRSQIRVGPRLHRDVLRALRHGAFRGAGRATRDAALRIGTDRRWNRVGIDAQQAMVSMRADIGQPKNCVFVKLLLDREIPFLDRWSFGVRLYSLRREDGAGLRNARAAGGRRRNTRNDRQDGSQGNAGVRDRSVAEARERATQTLQDEAVRRAVEGVRRPVLYRGKQVYIQGKPLFEIEYSDQLLIRLLEAFNPEKYGRRVEQINLMDMDPDKLTPEQLDCIAEHLIKKALAGQPEAVVAEARRRLEAGEAVTVEALAEEMTEEPGK